MTSARRVRLAGVRLRVEACLLLLARLLPLSPTTAVRGIVLPGVAAIRSSRDVPRRAGDLVFIRGALHDGSTWLRCVLSLSPPLLVPELLVCPLH